MTNPEIREIGRKKNVSGKKKNDGITNINKEKVI